METNSTKKLITITENKEIKFLRGDRVLFKKENNKLNELQKYKNKVIYLNKKDLNELERG